MGLPHVGHRAGSGTQAYQTRVSPSWGSSCLTPEQASPPPPGLEMRMEETVCSRGLWVPDRVTNSPKHPSPGGRQYPTGLLALGEAKRAQEVDQQALPEGPRQGRGGEGRSRLKTPCG